MFELQINVELFAISSASSIISGVDAWMESVTLCDCGRIATVVQLPWQIEVHCSHCGIS